MAFHHGIGGKRKEERLPGVKSKDDNIIGMRVSPSIYTSLREIDLFIEAVSHYVKNGLPA